MTRISHPSNVSADIPVFNADGRKLLRNRRNHCLYPLGLLEGWYFSFLQQVKKTQGAASLPAGTAPPFVGSLNAAAPFKDCIHGWGWKESVDGM